MASPNSGTSSGSTSLVQNSGSEEDLRQLMDQRKRKRKISNRESARRSRMRKQQHLDELTARVAELRKENGQIIAGISATTQQYLAVEGENSILRAQEAELSHRLQSLNEGVSQDMGIEAPIPLSIKLRDFNNVFRKILSAAEHPHLSIPETEAGRSRKQYHRLINRSLMFVSVGAAVAIVGLAAYRVYAARKNASG